MASALVSLYSVKEDKVDCKKRSHRQDVSTPTDDGANADNFVVYLAEFGDSSSTITGSAQSVVLRRPRFGRAIDIEE